MTLFDGVPHSGDLAVQLRDYQTAAIDGLYSWFEQGKHNPLIVVPTGGGKSLIIAGFVHRVLSQFPTERVLVLTHVKELIEQNHAAMLRAWPGCPAGIYSAGVGKREKDAQVLFAGIQSVHARASAIGWADLVLIDEAHLVPKSGFGLYRRFINDLLSMNSGLEVIGLTATPFRGSEGKLHGDAKSLFGGVAYECDMADLIERGFLSKIVARGSSAAIDTSKVHIRAGEFVASELQDAAMADDLVGRAVDEIVARGGDRKSWLLFGSGVEHATAIRDAVVARGFSCGAVFGNTPKEERAATIDQFKRGEIRAIANFGVLTTGFDAPQIDLIALLRPTQSPVLYVQMAGRGLRVAEGKADCLLLDFGGNVRRHGPINDVRINDKSGDGDGESGAPVRECPACHLIIAIAARECPECGHVFEREAETHDERPDETVEVVRMKVDMDILRWRVRKVRYSVHQKPDRPPTMRVTYECGFNESVSEWIALESDSPGGKRRAAMWWRTRSDQPTPATVDLAVTRAQGGELKTPWQITVNTAGEWPKILYWKFGEPEEDPDAGTGHDDEDSLAPSAIADDDIPF